MVKRYNRDEKETIVDAFNEEFLQQLSWASVSRSCLTDQQTCELVFQEILAKIADLTKNGQGIRLNFKVGYLICKSGMI